MTEDNVVEEKWYEADGAVAVMDDVDGADFSGFQARDIITITARLARVLAQEADYLEEMKVSKIADLQKDKLALADALTTIKKEVLKDPSILEDISDDEREEMRAVITIFNQILDENYRRLTVARAVNQEIVKAVTDVVCEHATNDVYDSKGSAHGQVVNSLSLSLDKQV